MSIHRRLLTRVASLTSAVLLIAVAEAVPATATSPGGPGFVQTATFPIHDPTDVQAGAGSVWVVSGYEEYENGQLTRIDPATNRVTARIPLSQPPGGLTIGFGSVWVSEYSANVVLRIDARTGHVQSRIRVGLQPQYLIIAFGSVWVSNHHGMSVSRIDPQRNRVVAQPTVGDPRQFRGGPQLMTHTADDIYVGASVNQSLTTISPRTSRVTSIWTTPADVFCGPLVATHGIVWSVDNCSNTLYRLQPAGRNISSTDFGTAALTSATLRAGALWVSYDANGPSATTPFSGGVLERLDPANGAVRETLDVGGDLSVVQALTGDLWIVDQQANTVRRIHLTG